MSGTQSPLSGVQCRAGLLENKVEDQSRTSGSMNTSEGGFRELPSARYKASPQNFRAGDKGQGWTHTCSCLAGIPSLTTVLHWTPPALLENTVCASESAACISAAQSLRSVEPVLKAAPSSSEGPVWVHLQNSPSVTMCSKLDIATVEPVPIETGQFGKLGLLVPRAAVKHDQAALALLERQT